MIAHLSSSVYIYYVGGVYGSENGQRLQAFAHLNERVSPKYSSHVSYAQNTQTFWVLVVCCRNQRRGAWKKLSPWNAARRLNWGVSAFNFPVSNGEPWVTSDGYKVAIWAVCASVMPGKKVFCMYVSNSASVVTLTFDKENSVPSSSQLPVMYGIAATLPAATSL